MSDTEKAVEELPDPVEHRKPRPPLSLSTTTPTSTAVKAMGAEDDFTDDDVNIFRRIFFENHYLKKESCHSLMIYVLLT